MERAPLQNKANTMRKIFALLALFSVLFLCGTADLVARAGRGDDCPPKSTDPDCK